MLVASYLLCRWYRTAFIGAKKCTKKKRTKAHMHTTSPQTDVNGKRMNWKLTKLILGLIAKWVGRVVLLNDKGPESRGGQGRRRRWRKRIQVSLGGWQIRFPSCACGIVPLPIYRHSKEMWLPLLLPLLWIFCVSVAVSVCAISGVFIAQHIIAHI